MRVALGERRRTGRAIDVGDWPVTAADVHESIRGEGALTVACPEPGRVYERVGVVEPGMTLSLHAVLAAAARSRGHTTPRDDELAAVRAQLSEIGVPEVDLADLRKRVADASGTETRLRERVATLQGRVQALRETGGDATETARELEDATRRLSEVETERLAAEQALSAARATVRTAREDRRRRLRLEDEASNLEREVRRELAERVGDEFAAALARVPGNGAVESDPSTFEGSPVTAALAAVRIAAVDAPVVLDCDRFESADHASARLDAPVIRL